MFLRCSSNNSVYFRIVSRADPDDRYDLRSSSVANCKRISTSVELPSQTTDGRTGGRPTLNATSARWLHGLPDGHTLRFREINRPRSTLFITPYAAFTLRADTHVCKLPPFKCYMVDVVETSAALTVATFTTLCYEYRELIRMSFCLSIVCLSRSRILSKWLNLSSKLFSTR